MTREQSLATPVAVVVGSLIIGAAIYTGLRQQSAQPGAPQEPPVASQPPAASSPTPPEAPSQLDSPPATPERPTVSDAEVQRQAQAALESAREGLVRACWTPPQADEASSVTLDYDITFAADGSIVMLGISENAEAHRDGLGQCVRSQPRPILPVESPGRPVRVSLSLQLP